MADGTADKSGGSELNISRDGMSLRGISFREFFSPPAVIAILLIAQTGIAGYVALRLVPEQVRVIQEGYDRIALANERNLQKILDANSLQAERVDREQTRILDYLRDSQRGERGEKNAGK